MQIIKRAKEKSRVKSMVFMGSNFYKKVKLWF